MKIWIDDVRPAPDGYVLAKSVNEAVDVITTVERTREYLYRVQEAAYEDGRDDYANTVDDFLSSDARGNIELIDIDHDAGDYAQYGGDYIKLLHWLEETGRNYPIRIHSMNPVGVTNMRAIIHRNGWREVL